VIVSPNPSDDLKRVLYFCGASLKSKHEGTFGSIQPTKEMKTILDMETLSVLTQLNIQSNNLSVDLDFQKTIFTYCRNVFDCALLISKLVRTIETTPPYITTNAVHEAAKLVKSEHYLDNRTIHILYPGDDSLISIQKLSKNIDHFAFLVRKGIILNNYELGVQINPIILS
jgi:hypothetical protein